MDQLNKRVHADDPRALVVLAAKYAQGEHGLPKDKKKAYDLCLKVGKLGYHQAYSSIGDKYYKGEGVNKDLKKAKYYYELAAIAGDSSARYNLGTLELKEMNVAQAMKHFMINSNYGDEESLGAVREGFKLGLVTKKDFEDCLRAYQKSTDEMKSEMRDRAARLSKYEPKIMSGELNLEERPDLLKELTRRSY